MSQNKKIYYADHVWTPNGWSHDVCLSGDSANSIQINENYLRDNAEYMGRYVLPGMPNLHSHAFQRAMAGLTEYRTSAVDTFWTWRETMYRFAAAIEPDSLKAIATQLYVEMLKSGFTHVCEFHYLHHQPDGKPYTDPMVMSLALIEAAQEAGIGLTLLPALYMTGGFDGRTLQDRQKRFFNTIDSYLALIENLQSVQNNNFNIGVAFHSLRAVLPEALNTIINSALINQNPVHIHIAEQLTEIEDCLVFRKARPVEWLLDHAPVNKQWCLVHATHINDWEIQHLAATGAVVGLCPTTEANLGDGLFSLKAYLEAGGQWGIGSDSHISVSPIEELRWLEYGQRLYYQQRNITTSQLASSVGETLWRSAYLGGRQASGVTSEGHITEWIVLDDQSPLLAGHSVSNTLDSLVFAGNQNLVRDVMIEGKWIVKDFHHIREEQIAGRYKRAIEKLDGLLVE